MNKNDFLKQYSVELTVEGPVFIGNGREIKKQEYIFNAKAGKIGIIDLPKFCGYLKSENPQLLDSFEKDVLYQQEGDIREWLKKKNIAIEDIKHCFKYSVGTGNNVEKIKEAKLMEFIKDPYGCPYVPGSSLKGMLRTVLLGSDILSEPNKYYNWRKSVEKAIQEKAIQADHKSRKNVLRRESAGLEAKCFRTLLRNDKRPDDAVNDSMSGITVSDSEPLSAENLVVCRKMEHKVDDRENPPPLLRECLSPGTVISFTVTVDTSRSKLTKERLLSAITGFYGNYAQCFDGFKRKKPGHYVYLGGGAGYASKTVTYPLLFGQPAGTRTAQQIFIKTGVSYKHGHSKDVSRHKVSPHILKMTRYNGKPAEMGLCSVKSIAEK